MKMNALPSEVAAIVGVIDPDVNAAGALTSAYVDMSKFNQVMAIVMAGTLGVSATLDAKIVQATDSSGTGSKDVTGKAITQLTQAGTDDSDKQAIINVRAEELDIDNGFSFAALTLTTAVATSDSGAVLVGFGASYAPASDSDLSSVAEVVN
jgi:hypothetical protein